MLSLLPNLTAFSCSLHKLAIITRGCYRKLNANYKYARSFRGLYRINLSGLSHIFLNKCIQNIHSRIHWKSPASMKYSWCWMLVEMPSLEFSYGQLRRDSKHWENCITLHILNKMHLKYPWRGHECVLRNTKCEHSFVRTITFLQNFILKLEIIQYL